ncbi:CHAT domain-containing protein [Tamlana sp. I1]|uniref:CHAT domain-containing protein n=1 Tax=Tamlana sp. I1 TaxID=2762061 RepID=UPI001890A38D|nr:CHAT domain-containing protein [Tamlana sp. I1]
MIKILLIKVNPIGTTNLFLDTEENNIEESRVASANRDFFEIKSKGAVTKDMLHSCLESYKPHILHISGHGSADGVLYFHDEENEKEELSISMFSEFIQNYKPNLKCVFMNACFSLNQDFIVTEDQVVIGMNNEVPNDTALTFSRAFYTSFFEGKTIMNSFRTAVDVVGIDGFGEESIPVLFGSTNLVLSNNTSEKIPVEVVPTENFTLIRAKREKRKRDYYILIGVTILISILLIIVSLTSGQDKLYTLVGLLPLGLIKWFKDKLDRIEDSLTLLMLLETEIKQFMERLQTPPIPESANDTAKNLNQQFWNIVK